MHRSHASPVVIKAAYPVTFLEIDLLNTLAEFYSTVNVYCTVLVGRSAEQILVSSYISEHCRMLQDFLWKENYRHIWRMPEGTALSRGNYKGRLTRIS